MNNELPTTLLTGKRAHQKHKIHKKWSKVAKHSCYTESHDQLGISYRN